MNGNLTIVLAAMALATNAARADLGDQLGKLLADDGAEGDQFGVFVAIDGTTALIGAYGDDDNGLSSGSAYLFDISDPANPTQLFKLLPDDGAPGELFGNEVAISGTTALVGAHYGGDNGSRSGSAYLFDTTTGQQLFKLLPDDGVENGTFSNSVAISANIAFVGAKAPDPGAVYLFDITTGQQIGKLLPDGGADGGRFGKDVAISGATAIVGDYWDDDNGANAGSAYLFDISDPANPVQLFKLLADDGARLDHFGGSVAINATTAVVGASSHDDNGTDSGAVYLFDTATGQQVFELLPTDGAPGDSFGGSVAIRGTTLVVSAHSDDDNGTNSGSAYLFDISDPANPVQIFKLLANDGAEGDIFGARVAISGDIALAGALRDDDNGTDSGSAYLFDVARSCPADIDGDGDADAEDFFAYLDFFASGDDRADIDGDGDIDAEDFFGYLDLFVQGCD